MSIADYGNLENNPNKDEIRRCRILIVEDDFVSRAVVKRVFISRGFSNISEAENGKIGLEKIRAEKPDLVITDIKMPVMDGFELCRLIRADSDKAIADVPILVQTGMNQMGDKVPIYQAGATDYLSKPIDPTELLARSIVYLEQAVLMRRVKSLLAKKF